ncbi:NAD(P)/FAD-dependent oxidoreductase [Georgenia sp. SYP-B2076]|uniref:dihydrolipoyl dehydrogenase family protein n=1 Tax=Georgenia sp. SYP-B2076 TaxID=2495881 RepID=UPI000F8EAC4D|nr:NAD(P)/FAD-dependent oxidoreductase [Georgenia sp. SYP-B2076]
MAQTAQTPDTFDVVVIGGGSTGENVADYAHEGGLSVAMVERGLVGGECSYYACMPSKALLRPGQALAAARRVDGAAQAVDGGLDAAAVLQRRTTFTHGWDDSSQVRWADGAGITVVRGSARLDGDRRVVVASEGGGAGEGEGGGAGAGAGGSGGAGAGGDAGTAGGGGERVLRARHAVVLATGSEPRTLPVEGLAGTRHWTTRDATSARAVPGSLVVVGAGVSGVELAQAYARLGARVTLVARHQVLASFAPQVSERVGRALGESGVDVREGVSPSSVERPGGPDAAVVVHLDDGTAVTADELLVAVGRRPATTGLGLETVGVQLDDGAPIEVDDSGRVTQVEDGWLYAAGDLTGRAPLTHQGKYAGRVVGDAIAARAAGTLGDEVEAWTRYASTSDHVAVPQVIFTDPEVAHVGLTDADAREHGRRVRTVEEDLGDVAGASLVADGYSGWAQLVLDDESDVVLGATFVGQDVAELLHAATIAVVGEVPLGRLWHAVPAYPTMSEVWLRLLEADRRR